jgi:hypothetical protein
VKQKKKNFIDHLNFCHFIKCYSRFSVSEEHLMGPPMSVCRVSYHIVTTVTFEHIVAAVTLDIIVATVTLYIIVAFVIPLVALLTSPPVMSRKEHLWRFNVLHRVNLPNFVL